MGFWLRIRTNQENKLKGGRKNQFRESDWKSELRLEGGNKRKGCLCKLRTLERDGERKMEVEFVGK